MLAFLVVAGGLQLRADFARASNTSVTLTTSTATVAPGSRVDLTASMPVVGAGTMSQEIVQEIDPTKVKLTSLADITYPSGWSLSFCSGASTDCSIAVNFSATTPANPAAWATVKAVKATGTLNSQGAEDGKQLATRLATGSAVSLAPGSIPSSGSGDGYEAFFDASRTRVFNLFHHGGNNGSVNDPLLDCHVISTGATCTGFPFRIGGLPTGHKVTGRVVGTKLWFTTGSPFSLLGSNTFLGQPGFGCVDLSAVLATVGNPGAHLRCAARLS